MIRRVLNTFLKYGVFKLPYVFVRWQLRKFIGKRRATRLSKLDVSKFVSCNETKFPDLYVSSDLDITRIVRGERKILSYGNDPEFKDRDIKSRWELNRFHHAPVVALNYKTFDSKKLLDDLFKTEKLNIAHFETNAMEVSISTINMITAYSLLDEAERNEYRLNISAFIQKSIVYIFNNLERGILYSANHYFFNIIGILWICESVEGDKLISNIKDEYYAKLEKLLDQFILKDGSLYEGSTYYHKYVTESLLLFIHEFDGKIKNNKLKSICSKMVGFANYASYNKHIIGIGDNDSGRILGLPTLYDYQSTNLTILNKLSSLLGVSVLSEKIDKDLIGDDFGLYHISNNNWHVAIRLEVGKRGYRRFIGGHCHNDQLHFTAFFKDMPLFVDSGVFSYIKYDNCRLKALKTSAHNTLLINDIEQNEIFKDFKYLPRNSVGKLLIKDESSFSGQYIVVNQNQNFFHKRTFELRDNLIFIDDVVLNPHQTEINNLKFSFHLHPNVKIIEHKDDFVIIFSGNKYFKISYINLDGRVNIIESFYSPEYGLRIKNFKVQYETSFVTNKKVKHRTVVTLLGDDHEFKR